MSNLTAVAAAKTAAAVKTVEEKKAVTAVVSVDTALKAFFKVLIDKNKESQVIDLTSKSKSIYTFKTRYFTVTAAKNIVSKRDVTDKSREFMIQSMLLKNSTIQAIYKCFRSTFNDAKSAKSAKLNNLTVENYSRKRFTKYFSQECNKIKANNSKNTCFVIVTALDK